jgi:hypothetical protein
MKAGADKRSPGGCAFRLFALLLRSLLCGMYLLHRSLTLLLGILGGFRFAGSTCRAGGGGLGQTTAGQQYGTGHQHDGRLHGGSPRVLAGASLAPYYAGA